MKEFYAGGLIFVACLNIVYYTLGLWIKPSVFAISIGMAIPMILLGRKS